MTPDITYGDPEPTPTVQYSGFVSTDGPADLDDVGFDLGTDYSQFDPVGTYNTTIAIGTASDNNYDFTPLLTSTFEVGKKQLTIIANSDTKFCGQTYVFDGSEFTTAGLVNNDVVTSATITSDGAPAIASQDDSPYVINISNAVGTGLENYNITYIPGSLTILGITIDASASSTPVNINATSVTLSATVSPAEEGVLVNFYLDEDWEGDGVTDENGTATLDVDVYGNLEVNVYKITAVAGNGCHEDIAYMPVYDPDGGFVTGGGWINSPAGAYVADLAAIGKANFGFNAKYKKGKSDVDGNTEFQFKAGNLNFKSQMHEPGSLVISGKKATYRGEGTINGEPGYKFVLVAIDGDWNGNSDPDEFRIKISTINGSLVYDNGLGADENGDAATILGDNGRGGGSIVIHEVKAAPGRNKSAEISLPETPAVAASMFKAYPNPFTDRLNFEFVPAADAQARIDMFDMTGRLVQTVFNQQVKAGVMYNAGFKPEAEVGGTYIYRMILGNNVQNGKVVYTR